MIYNDEAVKKRKFFYSPIAFIYLFFVIKICAILCEKICKKRNERGEESAEEFKRRITVCKV